MAERRFRGVTWVPPRERDGQITVEAATLHVLMDIRDELAELRKALQPARVASVEPAVPDLRGVPGDAFSRALRNVTGPGWLNEIGPTKVALSQRNHNRLARARLDAVKKAAKAKKRGRRA